MIKRIIVGICLIVAFAAIVPLSYLVSNFSLNKARESSRIVMELALCKQETIEYKEIKLVRYGASADVDALPCDYVWLVRIKEVRNEN